MAQAEEVADEGRAGECRQWIGLDGLAQVLAQRFRLGDGKLPGAFGNQAGGFLQAADFRLQRLDLFVDGGFRLGLFLIAGLLLEPKLQLAYALGLIPMMLGLYIGDKVHTDLTSEGMLRVVGVLLMLSGLMLFLKVAT